MATADRSREEPVDGLDVVVVERGGGILVKVTGEVDSYTAPLLRQRLDERLARSPGELVVDLGGTELIDSTGLGVLVAAASRLREQGGRLVLANASTFVREVLSLSGVDQLLDVVDGGDGLGA